VPAWVKTHRPCGAQWGFGNKLISINGKTITVNRFDSPQANTVEKRVMAFDAKIQEQGINQVLKEKIDTATKASNKQEMNELFAMKCLMSDDYDQFLARFDVDKMKMQFELDHFFGKKP